MSDSKKPELNLVETVNASLIEMIQGDAIKVMIENQLSSTIKSVIGSSMREYSDFGKVIQEKINAVINVAASNVELPEYTKFVSDVVLEQFDTVLQEQSRLQLTGLIEKQLGTLPSGVMMADQLFQKIVDSFTPEEYEEERTISVELIRSDSSAIYIKTNDEEKSEEIKISLYNHRAEDSNMFYIGYIDAGSSWNKRTTKDSEKSFNTHCMDEIQKFLFRLYCAQTNIDMTDMSDFEDFIVGGQDW